MRTIHKFVMPVETQIELPLTQGARILNVGEQGITPGMLVFWALYNTDSPQEIVRCRVFGTGMSIPTTVPGTRHFKTVLMRSGLVWHVFILDHKDSDG